MVFSMQDTYRFTGSEGKTLYTLNYGLRLAYWSFTKETILSPRLSLGIIPAFNENITMRFATGLYYQAPFFKEIRDTTTTNGITYASLNRKAKSQRSIHFIAGFDYRFKMNDPVSDRRALDARPDIVYITYSKDITIENINFKNSAFWTVVPLSSGNIVMHHLNLDCMNTPNRDGIDPVDCHDMTIYSCNIMAGDDGLCFKSSDPVGCYNIDVWDMMIQSLASGIKFGTDTYYCLKNAHITDCAIKNVNRCGISLETVDGAEVENVTFERIDMTDVGAPVYITVGARNRLPRGGAPVRKSGIKNVTFRDMRFDRAYPFSYTKNIREVMAVGQSPEQIMENILFENCDFTLAGGFSEIPGCPRPIDNRYPEYDRHGLSAGHGFTVRYAKDFRLSNVNITLESPDVRPLIAYFDCEEK